MKLILSAVTALVLSCGAALATPVLSGDYALLTDVTCQANGSSPGYGYVRIVNANFNSGTGNVTLTGDDYTIELVNGASGATTQAISKTEAYSNTDTTFTADGRTWDIQYGPLTGTSIARSFQTGGSFVSAGTTCVGSYVGIRKV